MKELRSFDENRISVRFEYEWHDTQGQWYRSHGNDSINGVKLEESARRYR
jgi:uncharacterized protein